MFTGCQCQIEYGPHRMWTLDTYSVIKFGRPYKIWDPGIIASNCVCVLLLGVPIVWGG